MRACAWPCAIWAEGVRAGTERGWSSKGKRGFVRAHAARVQGSSPGLSDAGVGAVSWRSMLPLGQIEAVKGWAMSGGPRRLGWWSEKVEPITKIGEEGGRSGREEREGVREKKEKKKNFLGF